MRALTFRGIGQLNGDLVFVVEWKISVKLSMVFFLRITIAATLLLQSVASAAPWPVADANLLACLVELSQKHGWKEPKDFQSIQCHNRHIASLDGLAAFSQITTLSLYNNDLRVANLQGFVLLRHLNLARNKLHALTLGDLPSLSKLYFFDNQIISMELANLPQLEEFKGNNNLLNTFNYKNLPNIKKVYLFNNQLQTIDIHQVPKLQYMDVRENPMPDELYEEMDAMPGITFLHDGNAEDW